MTRILAALIWLLAGPALADPIYWGTEAALCGDSHFDTTVGDGRNIRIIRITGAVTASSMEDASRWHAHQSLVTLFREGGKQEAVSVPRESGKQNNGVDGSVLFAVAPKILGWGTQAIPYDYQFDPPLLALRGKLTLRIDNIGPGPQKAGVDCVDTENHMVIQWRYDDGAIQQ